MRGFDHSQVVKEKRLPGCPWSGFEQVANLRGGAIAIVGEALRPHGTCGERSLRSDISMVTFHRLAAFFDGALDGIAGDRSFAGLSRGRQGGIHSDRSPSLAATMISRTILRSIDAFCALAFAAACFHCGQLLLIRVVVLIPQ